MMSGLSISHTAKTTFQRCEREYFLKYIAKLTPVETAKPLRMGSAFSDALEDWDEAAVDSWYEQYYDAVPGSQFKMGNEPDVVRIMAESYIARYVRHERELEIPAHEIGICSFRGFIDGRLDSGVLIEDKLKGMWMPADETALLKDDQVTGYVSMYANMTGSDPDDLEMEYRVTKKPQLRQKKTETEAEFLVRLRDTVLSEPEKYHLSFPLTRSLSDVSEWWENTRLVADRIEALSGKTDEKDWATNFSACKRYGSLCDMWNICSARDSLELEAVLGDQYKIKETDR